MDGGLLLKEGGLALTMNIVICPNAVLALLLPDRIRGWMVLLYTATLSCTGIGQPHTEPTDRGHGSAGDSQRWAQWVVMELMSVVPLA
jgi:hypothetical protein